MSPNRAKYANLIKRIDNKLLYEDPKKIHTYAFTKKITSELKETLIEEYAPHWKEIYFTKYRVWFVTVPVRDQGPILTPRFVDSMNTKAKWKFTLPEAGSVYPGWIKARRGR